MTTAEIEKTLYDLERKIPQLRQHVVLTTVYGDIHLHQKDAEKVANLVERLLRAQIDRAEKVTA
ncbi:MAG: hypothetical protein M0P19_11175 [Nevskia sp.]|jgi:hypothetical protein|nr:hypothetical protein [Nevskia sp.]MCK9385065.1 hypothetical protein [Nevskia sp.]